MSTGGGTARSDLLGGAGWMVFGLLIVAESLRMDRFTSMGATLYTMPGFMPGIVGSVIALLGAVLVLRGWQRARAAVRRADAAPQSTTPHADAARLINERMVLALPLTLLYAGALLGRLPFWLATAVFVAAFTGAFMPAQVAWRRRVAVSLASGVITTAVVMVVFQHVFLVRLP